jgi:hypothetical protein
MVKVTFSIYESFQTQSIRSEESLQGSLQLVSKPWKEWTDAEEEQQLTVPQK